MFFYPFVTSFGRLCRDHMKASRHRLARFSILSLNFASSSCGAKRHLCLHRPRPTGNEAPDGLPLPSVEAFRQAFEIGRAEGHAEKGLLPFGGETLLSRNERQNLSKFDIRASGRRPRKAQLWMDDALRAAYERQEVLGGSITDFKTWS